MEKKKALLIAEKQSLADAIRDGYGHYHNQYYDITYCACSGHLMELCLPEEYCEEWKKWDMNQLPIIPAQFKNKIKKSEYPLYKKIKDNLEKNSFDVVINAGDPAREGELIVDEILKSLNCTLPELRLWTDDLTVKGVCDAFDNLLQPQNNLKKAAYLREWYDQLIGINCSRAVSLATGSTISVGRVMSVVNSFVVNRDRKKENFKPSEYYECLITIDKNGETFEGKLMAAHNKISFNTREDIQELMNNADCNGQVIDVNKSTQSSTAPLLLNLIELQKESFSKYGYKPDEVLAAAQSLYEKKLISYPRTDCRYISTNVAEGLCDNLRTLARLPEYSQYISKILADTDSVNRICKHTNAYVDNSKLTDHHALITTTKPAVFTDLTERERHIYKLIARRLIAIFMPARVVSKTRVICQFGGITTISKCQNVVNEGYSLIMPVKIKNLTFPILNEGDDVSILNVEGEIYETQAPSYYNYRTLLEDMEKCGKFSKDPSNANILDSISGIGQSSTRDSIIKKLLNLEYIAEVGPSSKPHLESTAKGRYVADILKDSELVSVDATAIMESKLLAVEKGTYDANTYYLEMLDDIKRITEELKNLKIDKTLKNPFLDDAKKKNKSVNTDIICPLCGKNIVESSKGFFCEGCNDKSCKYFMKKSIYGVNISLQDFKAMLSGRKINRRFTWKSGKKSQAELGIENNKYKFYFN